MSEQKYQIPFFIRIYSECVDLIKDVLKDIPDDQLIWKPGAESRSIAEIARHILRVDNILFRKIDIEPLFEDTFSNERALIADKFDQQRDYVINLIRSSGDDEQFRIPLKQSEENEISLRSTMVHIIQHYLYHYAQVVYLRRVNDRSWKAPEKKWESVVDLIAEL